MHVKAWTSRVGDRLCSCYDFVFRSLQWENQYSILIRFNGELSLASLACPVGKPGFIRFLLNIRKREPVEALPMFGFFIKCCRRTINDFLRLCQKTICYGGFCLKRQNLIFRLLQFLVQFMSWNTFYYILSIIYGLIVSVDGQERALWNLEEMSICALGYPAIAYNNYGCWCGVGGSGKPMDGIDRLPFLSVSTVAEHWTSWDGD